MGNIIEEPKEQEEQGKTPALDNFGRDITELARQGKIDPIIGREDEIERVCQTLSRRRKNNPILVGVPGCGKSAIVSGIALRIVNKEVSRVLYNKRVIELDMGAIVAGTKYRGQFEERMKAIIEDVKGNRDIILFIDEIHTMVGAGSASGSLDAANLMKPALANGELQCIGATTLKEYKEHIEKDPALTRRFQKVLVEPTTIGETLEILHSLKSIYEDYHSVEFSDEAVEACVKLSDRYITDRFFPDKAIDIMDETGARIHMKNIHVPTSVSHLEDFIKDLKKRKDEVVKKQDYEEAGKLRDLTFETNDKLEIEIEKWEKESKQKKIKVTEDHVAKVIAISTGIPVDRISSSETKKLLKLDQELMKVIIGQDEAIKSVVKSIRRSRIGLKDKNKPVGVFMFCGKSGTGKSLTVKELSKQMFGHKDSLIRLDMTEYKESNSVTKIIGSAPGYVGYDEHNGLTEKVRHKPYSIILLDEIEKAHKDVWDIFLQLFDEGHMTDSQGTKVDFKNCIIIMTSNIGTREIQQFGSGIGFDSDVKSKSEGSSDKYKIMKSLEKEFKPEFINRIDDIIIFNSLTKDDLIKIVDLELDQVKERIQELEYTLSLDKKSKEFLIDEGYNDTRGARELKRTIQRYVEDPVAEMILNGIKDNSFITGKYVKSKKEIVFKVN